METVPINDALKTAIEITSGFEGNNGFSTVVGNFDGQGLTCGALGFAWGMGTHQSVVLDCEKNHPGTVLKMMPTIGSEYLTLVGVGAQLTLSNIMGWTDPVHKSQVISPYKEELSSLWGCPEMVESQMKRVQSVGDEALSDINIWNNGTEDQPTLQKFCFMFDVRVMNGSLKGLSRNDVARIVAAAGSYDAIGQQIESWCLAAQPSQSQYADLMQNGKYWQNIYSSVTQDLKDLFILAYLRSKMANPEFQCVTMNRKGSLSLGSGYVNGQLFDSKKYINLTLNVDNS